MHNWFARSQLFVFADAESKMKRFGITDPAVRLFVRKYDNLIPWNKIQNQQDKQAAINAYIAGELLPNLAAYFNPDSKDNYYLKNVDVEAKFKANPNDLLYRKAHELFQSDPLAAQKLILDTKNKEKADIWKAWWSYLRGSYVQRVMQGDRLYRETPIESPYKDSPAFIYMMMKSILNTSKANNEQPPAIMMFSAIEKLHKNLVKTDGKNLMEGVENAKPSSDLEESYVSIMRRSMSVGLEPFDPKDPSSGWLRIKSKKNDPENYDFNRDRLVSFSLGNGWCVGEYATTDGYLGGANHQVSGDFWMLIQNYRAKVAIRFEGDNPAEIEGQNNLPATSYAKEIVKFFTVKGLPQDNYSFKQLKAAIKETELFDEDPDFRKKYLDSIRKDYTKYKLLETHQQTQPDVQEAALDGYVYYIDNQPPKSDPRNDTELAIEVFRLNPTKVRTAWRNRWIRYIQNIDIAAGERPPEVEHLPVYLQSDPQINEMLIQPWLKYVESNPDEVVNIPEKLRDNPAIRKAYDDTMVKWRNIIMQIPDPVKLWEENIPMTIPQSVRRVPFIINAYQLAMRAKGMLDHPESYEHMSEEEQFMSRMELAKKLRNFPEYFGRLSFDLRQHEDIQVARIQGWINKLRTVTPTQQNLITTTGKPRDPEDLRDVPAIQQAKLEGWGKLLELNPRLWRLCPPEIQQKITGTIQNHPKLLQYLGEQEDMGL